MEKNSRTNELDGQILRSVCQCAFKNRKKAGWILLGEIEVNLRMTLSKKWARGGRRIEVEFRLCSRSLLGLVLRADEFQGGAEALGERGVHFNAQATNPARTSAGGAKKKFRIFPVPFFAQSPGSYSVILVI